MLTYVFSVADDAVSHCWSSKTSYATSISRPGFESFDTHQSIDAMLATSLAQLAQACSYLAIPIHAVRRQPELLDDFKQPSIVSFPIGLRPRLPLVIAAGMYTHQAAQGPDGMLGFVSHDESVLCGDSLTKNAAAFFKMSSSSVTRFSSAFCLRISSC